MPDDQSPPRKLVNKLSGEDARHLLPGEGSELTAAEFVLQLASVAAVPLLGARRLSHGQAYSQRNLLAKSDLLRSPPSRCHQP